MDATQVLAFRLARVGLASRDSEMPADAVACPASDFSRDAALLAVAARCERTARADYEEAVDSGAIALMHAPRGAIHALRPSDAGRFGRALIAAGDDELGRQLGQQVRREAQAHGFAPTEALRTVAGAVTAALDERGPLSKDDLHGALRQRLRPELLPWCKGCKSHHAAPMLWRYATVVAGATLDSARRYRIAPREGTGDDRAVPDGADAEATAAARAFLRWYGPATAAELADWAGLAPAHAKRLWAGLDGELVEVRVEGRGRWLLREDLAILESPPDADGVRLLPPGDPYLQPPNRPLLAPDAALRKRLFRPVASPGAVLVRGRLAGLWRMRMRGAKAEVAVEPLGALAEDAVRAEAERVGAARGADAVELATA